ncbi:MAG: hypothetical protein DBY38_02015 [Clostridium cadaveris]|uniref:ASCH domain-containing protein n=1 Tax=Clostridium cadaveris TaxID=1529 RepID=A0A316MA46_9CLOT|nr:MAG: hypothetical protein DBY38_02015 [Clostridium cadaveris]
MEKPILFNTDMVRAILEGRKTCTRRVIKNKYDNADITFFENKYGKRLVYMQNDTPKDIIHEDGSRTCHLKAYEEIKKPYEVGDILWVRETWTKLYKVDANGFTQWDKEKIYYAADGEPDVELVDEDGFLKEDQRIKWKPSIHMPKSLARIFLEVTSVRAERLKDITEDGAKAEGAISTAIENEDGTDYVGLYAIENFREIWNSTIKKEERHKYGWKANPWVWVIEFKEKIRKVS